MNWAIPYIACTVHSADINKQTGKMNSFICNFLVDLNILYTANVISIMEEQKMKEYSLGAICTLTKEELFRNNVPKQSRKKKNTSK